MRLRLALLREHASHPVFGRLRPDAEERARRLFASQLRSVGEVIFLAERAAAPVGILRCVHSVGSPLLYPDAYGYISSVYVVPTERRKGVLKRLLDAAEDWSRARGLAELRLYSLPALTGGSVVWDALGFARVEELRVRPIEER